MFGCDDDEDPLAPASPTPTVDKAKKLQLQSGASLTKCREALAAAGGDFGEALAALKATTGGALAREAVVGKGGLFGGSARNLRGPRAL